MQTFLPYPDFDASARALDRSRLGKQRVECLQILRANLGIATGWRNHPAARMWLGYEGALVRYTRAVCAEWVRRGYADTTWQQVEDLAFAAGVDVDRGLDPPWLGDERLHRSHRSNLRRKSESYYGPQWPETSSALPYHWPSKDEELVL